MIKLAGHPFDINIMQVYLPTSTCNDEDVEEIYEAIEEILKQTNSHVEISFVIGDMKAKVGRGKVGKEVGPYGLGNQK